MITAPLRILLAEDDPDDCYLFKKALDQMPYAFILHEVVDGEELMHYLETHEDTLPDILFLDLSMPRKNGFESLIEIKQHKKLKALRVVMFSTAFPSNMEYELTIIKILFDMGAIYFIQKANDFELQKQSIQKAILKAMNG